MDWYDPQTSRFLTQDPIGLAGGVNLYAYAGGNPVGSSDPFGLEPCYSRGHCTQSQGGAREGHRNETRARNFDAYLRLANEHAEAAARQEAKWDRMKAFEDMAIMGALGQAASTMMAASIPSGGGVQTSTQSPRMEAGFRVYRVFGDGSRALGRSWTPLNPGALRSARGTLGLPNQNTGRFVLEGVVTDATNVVTRSALPLHGNAGGGLEVLLASPSQVQVVRVSGANPPF